MSTGLTDHLIFYVFYTILYYLPSLLPSVCFPLFFSSNPPVEFFQCLYHTYTPNSLVFTLFPFYCDLTYFLFSWTQTFLLVYFYCRFYEKGMWLFHLYYLNVSLLNFSRIMLFTFSLVKDQL